MIFNINYAPFEEEPIEFDVDINLTDEDKQAIRMIIDPVADLSQGLMPILEDWGINQSMHDKDDTLYHKFDDVIFPKLFVEVLIQGLTNGTIKKDPSDNYDDLRSVDFDDLDMYYPVINIDYNDCFCEIPQELIPKVYLAKDDTQEGIHRYLLREQQDLMWSLYHDFTSGSILYNENEFDDSTWDWIKERLTKIVSERIKEANPEDLLRDNYNPLSDVCLKNLSTLYPDPIIEKKPILPECPAPLIDERFEDAFKTPEFDDNGYSESIPAIWGDFRLGEDSNGIKILSSFSALIESRLYYRYLDEESLVWDFGRNRLLLYEPNPESPRLAFKGGCWAYAKKLKPEYSHLSLKEIYLEKTEAIK